MQPTAGIANLRQVGLDCVRKVADLECGRQPGCGVPPWCFVLQAETLVIVASSWPWYLPMQSFGS